MSLIARRAGYKPWRLLKSQSQAVPAVHVPAPSHQLSGRIITGLDQGTSDTSELALQFCS